MPNIKAFWQQPGTGFVSHNNLTTRSSKYCSRNPPYIIRRNSNNGVSQRETQSWLSTMQALKTIVSRFSCRRTWRINATDQAQNSFLNHQLGQF
jgi:hypothetical protein